MFLWCAIIWLSLTLGVAVMMTSSSPHESPGIAVPP